MHTPRRSMRGEGVSQKLNLLRSAYLETDQGRGRSDKDLHSLWMPPNVVYG